MKSFFCFIICSLFTSILAQAQPPNISYTYEYPYSDGIPFFRYKERREMLRNSHSEKSLIISLSADIRNRQNDVNHPYRQSSNFLYLTGMPYPQSALILAPGGIMHEGKVSKEFLFINPRNSSKEAWEGALMGIEEAKMLDIETILPYSNLKTFVMEHLKGKDTIYFTGLPTANADEIRLMKKAIDISIEGHVSAMKQAKAGITEYELEAMMEYTFKKEGAEDIGYSSIMGAGYNACILHYNSNRKATLNGDLVLADCGAEYQNYTADITRTFPVNGIFSPDQKTLYDIVLEAADSAILESTIGNPFRAPHNAAKKVILKRLQALGIIETEDQLKWYFMHGTSHYLGLDVHDPGTGGTLKDGSIITVEPGIYIPPGSPCDKRWWNIGIRIEDDILITQQGPLNLSEALPRTTEGIEKLMKK